MITNLYLETLLIAVLGMVLKAWIKYFTLRGKARLSNVKFNPSEYIRLDWPLWVSSMIAIAIVMLMLKEWLNYKPWVIYAVKPLMGTVGYAGADIVISFFSASNKYINKVIDRKTTISDINMGTVNEPTDLKQVPK